MKVLTLMKKTGVEAIDRGSDYAGLHGMLAGTFFSVNVVGGLVNIEVIAHGYSLAERLALAGLALLPWLLKVEGTPPPIRVSGG
jgi:hypothetical protein